ncbi:MAG TPA: hypothetical protein VEA18_02055 [Candidatus Kapabacteria bacterium]|nr:hypothetical protein [Candidatus Kapabacteria bacterium]
MEQEKVLQDILETVHFLRDNAATKLELAELRSGITSELNELRNDMDSRFSGVFSHIDGFIGLHQKLDTELTSLRAK